MAGNRSERLESERERIAWGHHHRGQETFFAGGDLNELIKVTAADCASLHHMVLRPEGANCAAWITLGRPVVASGFQWRGAGRRLETARWLMPHIAIAIDQATL